MSDVKCRVVIEITSDSHVASLCRVEFVSDTLWDAVSSALCAIDDHSIDPRPRSDLFVAYVAADLLCEENYLFAPAFQVIQDYVSPRGES